MSVKHDHPPHVGDWDPNTQPRTQRELEAMIRHAVFVRWPDLKPAELKNVAEAVMVGVERYGLSFRRTAWKPPEGARLDVQTLADVPVDDMRFGCGMCPREETHKRRHLMDKFGSFRPIFEVPRLLSRDGEKKKTYGANWCRFTYAQHVKKVDDRNFNWMARQVRS